MAEPSIQYGFDYVTENALQWQINDQTSLLVDTKKHWKQDIFLSQSEVYFENKWSVVEVGEPGHQFVEFTHGTPRVESMDGRYSSVYFRMASKRRVYSLEPYKILDLLGDMGGLLDIIFAFGVLITIGYVKRAFARSLLGDAYQVQSYNENETEYYPSKQARKCLKKLRAKEAEAELHDQLFKSEEQPIKLTSTEDSQTDSDEERDNKDVKVLGINNEEVKNTNSMKQEIPQAKDRRMTTLLNNLALPQLAHNDLDESKAELGALIRHGTFVDRTGRSGSQGRNNDSNMLGVLTLPTVQPEFTRAKSEAPAQIRTQKTIGTELSEMGFHLETKQMESFIKENTKKHYISEKPKPQQLYFLYKLIMNRKKFSYALSDRLIVLCGNMFKCCKRRCPRRISLAEK